MTRLDDPTLRMYAVIREDLDMPPGKLASQAGHAFTDTFDLCRKIDPGRADDYMAPGHGTKVVASLKSEPQLRALHDAIKAAGIPCSLIIDSGHVLPPHFDGNPIVTALGIGPATRAETHHLTKRLKLVK